MEIDLADYEKVRAATEAALSKLDFRNPVQRWAGHEFLAVLNRLGALLEYQKKGDKAMGLRDDIITLEARLEAGQDVGQQLAEAYAEIITRKGSKRLVVAWFEDLAALLDKLERYSELITAAGGVDPDNVGVWDRQAAAAAWLTAQS